MVWKFFMNGPKQNPKQDSELETKRKETNRKTIIKMGTTGYERWSCTSRVKNMGGN
jgi:hypothetical protein